MKETKRSMVSILNKDEHKLHWLDVDKQVFDEDSDTCFEIKIFGLTIWRKAKNINTIHKIREKGGKTIGFEYGQSN